MVDLLREHSAEHSAAVLERDRRMGGDRGEQLAISVGERRLAVGDQLADLAAAPPQRLPDRMRARDPLRPGDPAVVEDERRTGGLQRVHRRLDDRLE